MKLVELYVSADRRFIADAIDGEPLVEGEWVRVEWGAVICECDVRIEEVHLNVVGVGAGLESRASVFISGGRRLLRGRCVERMRCPSTHDHVVFGGGVRIVGKVTVQCDRTRGHLGAHSARMPLAAGEDAGKLFAWPE